MKYSALLLLFLILCACHDTTPVDLVAAQRETEALIEMHRNGLHDQALHRGQEYLRSHPNAPGINYALAIIHGDKSNHPQAEQLFRNELKLSSRNMDSIRGLAVSLIEQGKNNEAMAFLQSQLQDNGTHDPQSNLLLAQLLSDNGDYSAAESRFLDAIDKGAIGADGEYGKSLMQQQRYQDAVPNLLRALQKDSENAGARNNLANALQSLGESDLAAQVREVQQKRSRLKDELNHVTSSSRLTGANAENFYNLGVVRTRAGKWSQALRAYSRALEMSEGKHVRAALGLAGLYQANRQYEEARKWAIHALILEPDNPKANMMIGLLRIISGDLDYAQQSFDKVKEIGAWKNGEQLLAAKTAREAKQWQFGLELLKVLPKEGDMIPELFALRAQMRVHQTAGFESALNDIRSSLDLDPKCTPCLLSSYIVGTMGNAPASDLSLWTDQLVNQSLLSVMLGAKVNDLGSDLIDIEPFGKHIQSLRLLVQKRYQEKFKAQ